MKDFFQERDTVTNIHDEASNEASNENLTNCVDADEPVFGENEEVIQDHTTEANASVTAQSQSQETLPNTNPTGSMQCVIPRKRTKHSVPNYASPKTAAATVMDYLLKKNESCNSCPPPPSPQHPVDAFLCGIAPSLKKLPPYYWHYAKSDIFAAVQKYELKLLLDQQKVPHALPQVSSPPYPEQGSPAGSSHHSNFVSEYPPPPPSSSHNQDQPTTPANCSLQDYFQSYAARN